MNAPTHHSAGLEHQGPLDLRPIEPDAIGEARTPIAGLLRSVKATDGHRAAVTAALAAILSATDVLIEFGAEMPALSTLRAASAPLEARAATRTAGTHGETRH